MVSQHSSNQYDTNCLLTCFFCNKEIPLISFTKADSKIVLSVKCLRKNKYKKIDLEDFLFNDNSKNINQHYNDYKICTTCSKRVNNESLDLHQNHIVIDEYINYICNTHNYTLSNYCAKCKVNICKFCLNKHSNHRILPIEEIDISIIQKYQKAIDLHITNITKYYDDFIEHLDSEQHGTKHKAASDNRMKSEITEEYETNILINEHLSELLRRILITIFTIKNSPCYQLMKLVNSIQINKPQPYQQELTIEDSFSTLRTYLKDNYALSYMNTENKKDKNMFYIAIPEKIIINRIPGIYEDLFSEAKLKHNSYILHAVRLLKDKYLSQGITALILDGKECRTSKALLQLGSRLTKLHIVEINCRTFNLIKMFSSDKSNIYVYNQHINQYVESILDPMINVVYFDVMCSYFSSEKSNGSDKIIKEYLDKVKREEIIFAATFCLRNSTSFNFEKQSKEIMIELDEQFKHHGYQSKLLLNKDEITYKGQRANQKGMMFVLYHLLQVDMF